MRPLLALLVASSLMGCTVTHEVDRAPRLEPPPARAGDALSKDDALSIAKDPDTERAIEQLDEHRFGFVLDASTLAWFEKQGAPDEVLDYLKKRTRVDWEGLRGDVDTESPEREPIDPRRGFDDWAGFGRRESYASYGWRDPFAR